MDNVVIAALLLGLSQILAVLALSRMIRRIINAKQAELEARAEAAMHKWLDAQEGGKPSKMAEVLDAGGTVIGLAAARSIMGALSAEKSHTARAANGMTDEIIGGQNPILGLLSGGKRGKGAALARLAEVLGPMLMGGNKNGGDNGAQSSGAGSVSARIREKAR
jgi:hypothetical protein